jgi:surface protein
MFNNCSNLIQLDMSNFDTSKANNTTNMFNGAENLIVIGMIYCSLNTVNTLSSLLPTTTAKQVYVEDVKASECTEVSNITFIDYISNSYIITPPVTLTPGDKILWDDSLQRYIIKRLDGSRIETIISSKYKIDLYIPYTMVYADNVTSISININRKET